VFKYVNDEYIIQRPERWHWEPILFRFGCKLFFPL
jgi:hypothetical protein